MSQNNTTASGGIGFLGILTLIFITLKLTGFINWSWWWVLLPLYGPLALVLAIVLIVLAIAGIAAGGAYLLSRR